MSSSNVIQSPLGFDETFDTFKSAFTVPILKDQHLAFIGAANRFIRTSLSTISVTNKMTGFEEASPELRLLSSKAIYRLELWIDTLIASKHHQGGELPLPPLDVLIMLNAYMLSPRPFLEDVRVRDLLDLQSFPIKDIAARIQGGEYLPTKRDMDSWMEKVKVPFNIAQMPEFININCPRCAGSLCVEWEESSGSGYGQAGFGTTCPSCPKLVVNHDALCAGKFLTDFVACQHSHYRVLMGTLLDQEGVRDDVKGGRVIFNELVQTLGKTNRTDLGDKFSWSMDAILNHLMTAKSTRLQTKDIKSQLRSYLNSSPFTADLVEKAFSYVDFSEAFRKDGWFDGSKDEASKVEALTAAVEDYRDFIRIFGETNKMGFVTHELDIVWHAHQLMGPQKYRRQTVQLIGVVLDHVPVAMSADNRENFDAALQDYSGEHGFSTYSSMVATCTAPSIGPTTVNSSAGPTTTHAEDPTGSTDTQVENLLEASDEESLNMSLYEKGKSKRKTHTKHPSRAVTSKTCTLKKRDGTVAAIITTDTVTDIVSVITPAISCRGLTSGTTITKTTTTTTARRINSFGLADRESVTVTIVTTTLRTEDGKSSWKTQVTKPRRGKWKDV
ncbi:hypothetical protein FRB96_005851 [Tulasnella sp. 330]|nr:hypothetical protein FRB96_005851 [Tulasnella sp. 330]KAG8868546.1 hypothetical protein FRB97_002225 [Tulasnella sp. 331]KAG8869803.1 hypothetical protein FRB98_002174 [Tulasnella sp. 332]